MTGSKTTTRGFLTVFVLLLTAGTFSLNSWKEEEGAILDSSFALF